MQSLKLYVFFILIIILGSIADGSHRSKVIGSSSGTMVLELSIDTIIVDQNKLKVMPYLSLDKTPGKYSLPKDIVPLVNIPRNAKILIERSDPIVLMNFNPRINGNEKINNGSLNLVEQQHRMPSASNNKGIYIVESRPINGDIVSLLNIDIIEKVNGMWVWYKKTEIEIKWNGSGQTRLLSDYLSKDHRSSRHQTMELDQNIPEYMISNNLIRIDINSDGLYRIPLDSLYSLDPSIESIDMNMIQLFSDGVEQLIDIDPSLGLVFFGKAAPPPEAVDYDHNFYTSTNHYWLTWGNAESSRYGIENVYPSEDMNTVQIPSTFISSKKFESNQKSIGLGGINTNEQWDSFEHFFFDPTIIGGGNQDYDLNISDPSSDGSYRVRIKLQGVIDGLRRVNITLNDRLLGSLEWSGHVTQEFISNEFPNEDLFNGMNKLYISVEDLDGAVDKVALDWVELEFDRKYVVDDDQLNFNRNGDYYSTSHFNVSGFTSPNILIYKIGETRLVDFIMTESDNAWIATFQDQILDQSQRYFCSTIDKIPYPLSVKKVDPLDDVHFAQSNYIIIAPDSFRQALEPMIGHYNAAQKTPESIYRTYSNGVISPYAIREFLSDAYLSWSVLPEYVLIAQDKRIPAMSIQTVLYGAASSDYWYTLLEGDDHVPEISIGRFPAATRSELDVMVTKNMHVINAEDHIWGNSVLMIAGYENEFRIQTEELIPNVIEKGFFPERLYVDMYSEGGPFYGTTETLIDHFENGLSYVNFFGHGGGAVWGDRSLFTLQDFSNLNNYNKIPFVTSMTCFTGDANNPNALGKRMLAHASGGSYGWFGSSGVGWVVNDYLLLRPIHDRLFGVESEALTMGKIINQSKMEYLFNNIIWPDIALTQLFQFNLLGDPAILGPNYNTIDVQPENYSIHSESNLELNIDSDVFDSLTIQWLDEEYFPLTEKMIINDPTIDLPSDIDSSRLTLVGVYKDENSSNNQFSVSIEIDEPYIEIKDIEPENPIHGDSISFVANIDVLDEILSVECWLDSAFYTNMFQDEETIYRLENKIHTSLSGSRIIAYVKVITSDNSVYWSLPIEIQTLSEIDVQPISIQLPTSKRIGLMNSLINKSNGFGSYYLSLDAQWEGDSTYSQLYYDSSFISPYEQISDIIDLPLPSGSHNFSISIDNKRNFIQDTIYTIDTTILVDRFWITPSNGTTEDLENNDTVTYGSLDLFVGPDVINEDKIVFFNQIEDINVGDQQTSLSPIIDDEFLKPINIQIENEVPWISFWQCTRGYENDTLLFGFNEQFGLWTPILGDWNDNKYTFSGIGSMDLVWMRSNDKTPPVLEGTIDGQRLLKGSYIGPEPEIIIFVRDESGIEFEKTKFFKNGQDWDVTNDVDIDQNGILTHITLNPKLSQNDRTISFITSDMMGNESDTLTLDFFITQEMEIMDYGNFPNPFNIQTRFSYELTRTADDLKLILYTVSGRKVREFNNSNYLLNSGLNTSGYHEIVWDGRDEWGSEVANGIYFYKYTIKFDDRTFNSIGKVGRSR